MKIYSSFGHKRMASHRGVLSAEAARKALNPYSAAREITNLSFGVVDRWEPLPLGASTSLCTCLCGDEGRGRGVS